MSMTDESIREDMPWVNARPGEVTVYPQDAEVLMQKALDTQVSQPRYKNGREVFPIQCPDCGDTMLWPSYRCHARDQHNKVSDSKDYDSLRFYGEYKTQIGRRAGRSPHKLSTKAAKAKTAKPAPPVATEPKVPKVKTAPWVDPNALVTTVLSALYPKGSVPIPHLSAVQRWVEATTKFIEETS